MRVEQAKATLSQMLEEAGQTSVTLDFATVWRVLQAFCCMPVESEQGLPPEEQFSWEFHLDEPDAPQYFVAGFLRSMAFGSTAYIEECFCSIYFAYHPSYAIFWEPEVVEFFDATELKAFFAATENAQGFQAALAGSPRKIDLHQAAL